MSKALETYHVLSNLEKLGINSNDGQALRRISMALHRWFERECGDDHGCIERDEETNKTYWLNAMTGKRFPIADRETGAKKRLAKIMAQYSNLVPYIQGDCRGAALYILRKSDIHEGESLDSIYTRGICVY